MLLILVLLAWLLWAVGALHGHHIAKREGRVRADSGVSVAPIIPLFPLGFFGLAKLIDQAASPWGTWLVGGLHVLLALAFTLAIAWQTIRHRRVRT
jgi:hypothetical protein